MSKPLSKSDLLSQMEREGILDTRLRQAFEAVPREAFVPPDLEPYAYADAALPLAEGSTISQPSMIALMLSELLVQPGMTVLEVGSGSGYVLALLSALGCQVTGIEINAGLAERSRHALRASSGVVEVLIGDASTTEFCEQFDRILISAAVDDKPSWAMKWLAPGGFVLAPVRQLMDQELIRYFADRSERTGKLCRFVPFVTLTSPD